MSYRLRLSLSMYWRTLLLTVAFVAVARMLFSPTALVSDVSYVKLQPTVFYGLLGLCLLLSLAATRNGLVYLAWGARLRQTTPFWRRFTLALALTLLVVALTNLPAAYALSTAQWVQLKSVVPALMVLLVTVAATLVLTREASVRS